VTDQAGNTHVFGRDKDTGGLTQYIYNASSKQWSFQRLPALPGVILDADPSAFLDSTGKAAAMVTTSAGHLLVYDPAVSIAPIDLTAVAPDKLVYSTVGVVEVGGRIYAYGTDQKGDMIEYSYNSGNGPSSITNGDVRVLASTTGTPLPKVFQDVEVTADGDIRHVFATDGNSRLIQIQVGPGNQVSGENVTASLFTNPGSKIVGYSSYQLPFAGRVYPQVSALVDPATHDLYVYGTNGRDLVQFHLTAGGAWQVDDLTNNVTGNPNVNFPANRVFGAPGAYILPDGSQHVLQIDEQGEVIEYYQLGRGSTFNTQNITLGQGQGSAPSSSPLVNQPFHQTQLIGPQATPLLPSQGDPSGLSFQSFGTLQNTHARASFSFRATRAGIVVVSLQSPFSVLELNAYNPHRHLIQRSKHEVLTTDVFGNTFYLNQVALNVVAGQTYFFLVKGMPRPARHPQPPGFGSFTILAQYRQVVTGQSLPVSTLTKGSHALNSARHRPIHGALISRAKSPGARKAEPPR
jgi:hypothetical protein